MRYVLAALLGVALRATTTCDGSECDCAFPNTPIVSPEDEQVLALWDIGRVVVSVSGFNAIHITGVTLTSEPEGAFELADPSFVAPTEEHPLTLMGDKQAEIRVWVTPSHSVREPASATLRIGFGDGRSVTRTFRLEPPTPHLRVESASWPTPRCVDAGEIGTYVISLVSSGAADVTLRTIERTRADPGYSVTVDGRTYPLDHHVITLDPPLVLKPGYRTEAIVQYASSGLERADAWLLFRSDDPRAPDPQLATDLAFNFDCAPIFDAPLFAPVAVGQRETIDVELRPAEGESFFRFTSIAVHDDKTDDGPANGFSIDPADMPAAGVYRAPLLVPVTFQPPHVGLHTAELQVCVPGGCSGTIIQAVGQAAPGE